MPHDAHPPTATGPPGRWRTRLALAVATVALAVAALAPAAVAAPLAPALEPTLRQVAFREPDAIVPVIVQKASRFSVDAEATTERLGGTITKRLTIINAFAAEVPAKALLEISSCRDVRAVTLDSGMRQSVGDVTFTTWATSIGTSVATTFENASAMVDSSFGANGTYGSGAKVTGAFGGFNASVTPGYTIQKVEILLHGYVVAPLPAGQDPKLSIVVNGVTGKEITLNHHAFDGLIGPAGAGEAAADITGTRTWKWSDFEQDIEVKINQSKFNSTSSIYYDAVGFRVTAAPGADASGDDAITTSAAVGPVDASKLANAYNAAIKAPSVWNGSGYLQGNKVGVAVVDSGVVKTKDLSGRNKKNISFNLAFHNGNDLYGHGTFVAGIIAGSGNASNGKYMGVAPKADYVNVRVSDDQGACSESDVVNALQWIYENHDKYNIRVVNLSLNSDTAQSYMTSPLDAACEILWFNGVVVVASAGNNGDSNLYPPANDPFVITVGAADDKGTVTLSDDTVASFSAYGMSEAGTAKPELVAPGKDIIGLLPENGKLRIGIEHPGNRVDATFFRMSGTSMAAPMVTGAVAILLQDEPALTPDQVKYRLMATANKNWPGYTSTSAGAGYLDVLAAVNGTTTESANTGLPASQMLWTGDQPVTWDSVMWRSVMWRSVSWDSVMWRSVMWRSVMWRSDYWGQ